MTRKSVLFDDFVRQLLKASVRERRGLLSGYRRLLGRATTRRSAEAGPPAGWRYATVVWAASFLLTGGREKEVLGLEVDDISFDRKTITFRPNNWRRLKTATSFRTVPMWPQLENALQQWVFGAGRPIGKLLFPSYRTGHEAMATDFRKLLDAVGARAGWRAGEIRSKMFRHSYCAARLQTLDQGAPVSIYTVARELGHGGDSMVKRVYGHLGTVRHRAEVVEYRVEQHVKKLGDRLTQLRPNPAFVTTFVTTD